MWLSRWFPYGHGRYLLIEVTISNAVYNRVTSTKLLTQGSDYDKSFAKDNAQISRHTHSIPLQQGHAPIIFHLDDREVHVGCHPFAITNFRTPGQPQEPPSPSLMYRFVVTVDLVGFKAAPEKSPGPSMDASSVNADTTSIRAPDSPPPPSPDTPAPMNRANGEETLPLQARRLPPAFMSGLGLAQYAHAANHLIRAGLRTATEWLGKEADYTCGQLVWDEWAVGGM